MKTKGDKIKAWRWLAAALALELVTTTVGAQEKPGRVGARGASVVKVSGTSLTVKSTRAGVEVLQDFAVTAKTLVLSLTKHIKAGDVEVDNWSIVLGHTDGQGAFTAARIAVLTKVPEKAVASSDETTVVGVLEIEGDKGRVKVGDKSVSITFDDGTKFYAATVTKLIDVKAGDRVDVVAHKNDKGEVVVTYILVRPKGRAKPNAEASKPAAPKAEKKEASTPLTSQTEAPKTVSIAKFPKPVQDAIVKELGENPALLAAEERKGKKEVDYSVKARLPENRELQLRILASGYVLFREVSGVTLEELPKAVRAAAEKEIGKLKPAPGVKFFISKKTTENETEYILRKTANQFETRLEILDDGRPLVKREVKKLADLPKGVQDAVNRETATTPGATVTVRWVTKFDYWEGKPQERFFTADVRGKGLAVDLKLDEYGTVLDREER